MARTAVCVERGAKRTFASAIDWPGWSRSARSEDEALAALLRYGPRYAKAIRRAAPHFAAPATASDLAVVERLKGGAGTDFGVPSVAAKGDARPIRPSELDEIVAILEASWSALDRAARAAEGVTLTKGPRGGGRDLAKIVAHCAEADAAYIVALGARAPKGAVTGPSAVSGVRAAIVDAVRARATGRPVAEPSRTKKPWTVRYFARRCAWHTLDHAWEIEDRASPGG